MLFSSLYQYFISIHPLQNGLDTKVEKSRKQMKERKNRAKKIRGVKKVRELIIFASAYTDLFKLS